MSRRRLLRPLLALKRRKKRAGPPRLSRLMGFVVDARLAALGIGTAVVLSILMSIHFVPDKVALNIGDRSPTEIRAARSVTYFDTDATSRRRADAARRVPSSYDSDRAAIAQATRYVSDLFDTVHRIRSAPGPSNSIRKFETLSTELRALLTPDQIHWLLRAPSATLDHLQGTARRLVESAMAEPIRSDTGDLERARQGYYAET